LGYPIVSLYGKFFGLVQQQKEILAINQARYRPTIQWWLICEFFPEYNVLLYFLVIIIGCSLLICIAGWLVMFIYYNTCALPLRQYTTYTSENKAEEPSTSHAQPTDTTQVKYITERESLASPKRY
jgi:hypothetical protein